MKNKNKASSFDKSKIEKRSSTQKKEIIKNIHFSWVGVDKRGKEVSGDIQAVSEINAKIALRNKGITVKKLKKNNNFFAKKVKQEDVSVFTRQLATMMKAGVPLIQSFDIVANGHENPSVSKLLYDIKNDIETGTSLEKAFAKHPEQFDELFCNLIGAGEKAGILDQILDKIAEYQEKMLSIKKKIKSALTYPIAIMGVASIVTAILMIFVVPSFKSVFDSFGAELPMPTQVVISISDFFVAYWYIMFGSIVGVIAFLSNLLKKSESARNKRDELLLKAPIFGKIIRKAIMARWARTLATMSTAGVPLVEALDSVAGASGNYVYSSATKNIQKDVSTGTSLTISMNDQKVFPNMMIQMTQIGEESGSVDLMLNKVAESFEEEVDNAISSLSSLMEPIIISFLGIVVGGLVVAMYLPIFKMAGAV